MLCAKLCAISSLSHTKHACNQRQYSHHVFFRLRRCCVSGPLGQLVRANHSSKSKEKKSQQK